MKKDKEIFSAKEKNVFTLGVFHFKNNERFQFIQSDRSKT